MSKELEALRNFISECENDWKTQPKRWVDRAINSNVSKYMDSLKSILTPPTAEEVCGKKLEMINHEETLEALEILKNRITTLSLNHKIGSRDIAKLEVKDIVRSIETHVIPTLEKALERAKKVEEFLYNNYRELYNYMEDKER